MNIKQFENLILTELKKIVENIIKNNLYLDISAKSRAGAEISDFLEEELVKNTKNNKYFFNTEASPKGATKNPWDALTFFKIKTHTEEIWVDFKALKISSADSNPDIGTPDKVIKFIKRGGFYLVYVYVYYQEKNGGLEFVKLNKNYCKLYFLKDINHTFRRNPKNQLQVNMSVRPEYRSRKDFIKLLSKKIKESHDRQIEISIKKLKVLDKLEKELLNKNKLSESKIIKKT